MVTSRAVNAVAGQWKNYRYSTNHQVAIDADTRMVVVGRPLPGNRNDCKVWEESGAKAAVGKTITIANDSYPGSGLLMPHCRRKGEELPDWKKAHNKSHKQARARIEHAFARMKTWKILRNYCLKATVFATPCAASRACTISPAPDRWGGPRPHSEQSHPHRPIDHLRDSPKNDRVKRVHDLFDSGDRARGRAEALCISEFPPETSRGRRSHRKQEQTVTGLRGRKHLTVRNPIRP